MKILHLSVADKHLLFGLILKKMLSRKEDKELVKTLHRVENLNKKIETLLDLYEKQLFELKGLEQGNGESDNDACVIVKENPDIFEAVKTKINTDVFILEADCALDCLVYAKTFKLKLIVMDDDMSVYDNYLVSRIIYKLNKKIPIIYLCEVSPEEHNYYIANKRELNIHYLKKEKKLDNILKKIESYL